MAKEDFSQRVLEQQIFDEIKDCPIKNAMYIKQKYKGAGINVNRLYIRIVNYQIKKYGSTIDNHIPKRYKYESERIRNRERGRKNYWRNK